MSGDQSAPAGAPQAPAAGGEIEIKITATPDGNVHVNAPLHLEVLVLGALERAKALVIDWNKDRRRREERQGITLANMAELKKALN